MGKLDVLFKDSGKEKKEDLQFIRNMSGEELENIVFTRSIATKIKFTRVNFKYCIFDNSYFRDCVFDSCDFTGCKFTGSNLNGSTFIDCKLIYVIFERTIVDFPALIVSLPKEENLRAKLLRSLRMNFQQQGDASSVNQAFALELEATKIHLKKSWLSNEEYYLKKYPGFKRIGKFSEWVAFYILDIIWGNGESAKKLFRTLLIVLLFISLWEVYKLPDANNASSIIHCFALSPSIFFGVVNNKQNYDEWAITLILFLRLVIFGLFMTILIKKISRR